MKIYVGDLGGCEAVTESDTPAQRSRKERACGAFYEDRFEGGWHFEYLGSSASTCSSKTPQAMWTTNWENECQVYGLDQQTNRDTS